MNTSKPNRHFSVLIVVIILSVIMILLSSSLTIVAVEIATVLLGYFLSKSYNLDWLDGFNTQDTKAFLLLLLIAALMVIVVFIVGNDQWRSIVAMAYLGFLGGRSYYKYQVPKLI